MAAFKYHTHKSVNVVTYRDDRGSHRVDVFRKDGRTQSVYWIGFKPRDLEVEPPFGVWRYVKMAAISVTAGTGGFESRWRVLCPGEYVLALMVFYNASDPGVYTLLDDSGCPIVLGTRTLPIAV